MEFYRKELNSVFELPRGSDQYWATPNQACHCECIAELTLDFDNREHEILSKYCFHINLDTGAFSGFGFSGKDIHDFAQHALGLTFEQAAVYIRRKYLDGTRGLGDMEA